VRWCEGEAAKGYGCCGLRAEASRGGSLHLCVGPAH
jgi:hypothetical protein